MEKLTKREQDIVQAYRCFWNLLHDFIKDAIKDIEKRFDIKIEIESPKRDDLKIRTAINNCLIACYKDKREPLNLILDGNEADIYYKHNDKIWDQAREVTIKAALLNDEKFNAHGDDREKYFISSDTIKLILEIFKLIYRGGGLGRKECGDLGGIAYFITCGI